MRRKNKKRYRMFGKGSAPSIISVPALHLVMCWHTAPFTCFTALYFALFSYYFIFYVGNNPVYGVVSSALDEGTFQC